MKAIENRFCGKIAEKIILLVGAWLLGFSSFFIYLLNICGKNGAFSLFRVSELSGIHNNHPHQLLSKTVIKLMTT